MSRPCPFWVQKVFLLADVDADGALSQAEHFEFQHPEESTHAAIHLHLLAEDIRDRSANHTSTTCAARFPVSSRVGKY